MQTATWLSLVIFVVLQVARIVAGLVLYKTNKWRESQQCDLEQNADYLETEEQIADYQQRSTALALPFFPERHPTFTTVAKHITGWLSLAALAATIILVILR
ncbi:MAG: hypothetical protein A2445_03040 [Candidatus Jacksonbacteria bacterium RIFOXYC2_FULL_44_29]|nr:MAG: hypothetical protein A2240_04090 [Candidatus Jacksonbacteria bacterium RIFOXYA2_FULL_43_12]OGY80072.1 MAG: hypothetical protein A2445_03040 [Candidatus Jacksonbacteria bacterium RIFOXYC2_FULL_44_29]OGY81731.1 MAG: hypothetical protein A2550_01010 [Candidatus Jacksonbacteria bacterium RIFOXYD2_FULL_43_21]HBH46831.1 hypothetical protein [Candidatus Jacksonbacteria bacterium]HCC49456.1 hypothetical protein [Candidatus Jacksonbacteria bacterium]